MGRTAKAFVEFVRAGALAAGTAMLLGLWFQGMHRLGFRGNYPDGLVDFLLPTVVGVAFGATLGHPEPEKRIGAFLARVVGTAMTGIPVGALVAGGGSYLLVETFHVAERNLGPFFLVAGVALVAVGVRRVPVGRVPRAVLASVVGLFVTMRVLAVWPSAAHRVTRVFFPFPRERLRPIFDSRCGTVCANGRTKVAGFDTKVTYDTLDDLLSCEAEAHAVLEATKPFFVDACGDAHDTAPIVPDWVHAYPSYEACVKDHPPPVFMEDVVYGGDDEKPSPTSECCLFSATERRVGERFDATRGWPFVFVRWKWTGYQEDL